MISENMKSLLDEILKASPEEKVKLGEEALNKFHISLTKNGVNGETIAKIIVNLTRFFVSADSNCSSYEHSYFRAVSGIELSYDEFYKLTNGGRDPKFIDDTLKFLNGLDEEARSAAITYGIAMLSSDLKYSEVELEIIAKMLELEGEKEPKLSEKDKAIIEKSLEITEDILKNCIVLGDEKESQKRIDAKLKEIASRCESVDDAKAGYLAVKRLEELTFEQLEELHKTVK